MATSLEIINTYLKAHPQVASHPSLLPAVHRFQPPPSLTPIDLARFEATIDALLVSDSLNYGDACKPCLDVILTAVLKSELRPLKHPGFMALIFLLEQPEGQRFLIDELLRILSETSKYVAADQNSTTKRFSDSKSEKHGIFIRDVFSYLALPAYAGVPMTVALSKLKSDDTFLTVVTDALAKHSQVTALLNRELLFGELNIVRSPSTKLRAKRRKSHRQTTQRPGTKLKSYSNSKFTKNWKARTSKITGNKVTRIHVRASMQSSRLGLRHAERIIESRIVSSTPSLTDLPALEPQQCAQVLQSLFDEHQFEVLTWCILILIFPMPPLQLLRVRFNRPSDNTRDHWPWFDPKTRYLHFVLKGCPPNYKSQEVRVALPPQLAKALSWVLTARSLQSQKQQLPHKLLRIINRHLKGLGERITLNRFQQSGARYLMLTTAPMGPLECCVLKGEITALEMPPSTYRPIKFELLQRHWSTCCQHITTELFLLPLHPALQWISHWITPPPNIDPGEIGTFLAVDDPTILRWAASLRNTIPKSVVDATGAPSVEKVLGWLNGTMTLYFLNLSVDAGIRIFNSKNSYLWLEGSYQPKIGPRVDVYAHDKPVMTSSAPRVNAMGERHARQVKDLLDDLTQALTLLRERCLIPLSRELTDLLKHLSKRSRRRELTVIPIPLGYWRVKRKALCLLPWKSDHLRTSINQCDSTLWTESLPLNTTRHRFATQLANDQIPEPVIAHHMSHISSHTPLTCSLSFLSSLAIPRLTDGPTTLAHPLPRLRTKPY